MIESRSLNRRRFIQTASVLGAGLLLPNSRSFSKTSSRNILTLTVLHTNDVHSRIDPFPMDGGPFQGLGGVARRSTLINQIREEQEHVLLFDAGDFLQGTPYFNLFGGELELKLMNKLKYDAATLGNHEFDNGLDGLSKIAPLADFPMIVSNYDFSNTVLEGKTLPYKVFKKGKIKVGVFGLGIDIKGLVDPKNIQGMKYLDPIETAQNITHRLKVKEKCDFIICLSHLGFQYKDGRISDIVLAKNSKNIDLIIGGHTHTFLEKPVIEKNMEGKSVYINQTGFGGVYLGRMDFTFEKSDHSKSNATYSYKMDELASSNQRV